MLWWIRLKSLIDYSELSFKEGFDKIWYLASSSYPSAAAVWSFFMVVVDTVVPNVCKRSIPSFVRPWWWTIIQSYREVLKNSNQCLALLQYYCIGHLAYMFDNQINILIALAQTWYWEEHSGSGCKHTHVSVGNFEDRREDGSYLRLKSAQSLLFRSFCFSEI